MRNGVCSGFPPCSGKQEIGRQAKTEHMIYVIYPFGLLANVIQEKKLAHDSLWGSRSGVVCTKEFNANINNYRIK